MICWENWGELNARLREIIHNNIISIVLRKQSARQVCFNERNILKPNRFDLAMDQVDKWPEFLRLHGNVRAVQCTYFKELILG